MNKEIEFAKKIEELKKLARKQGNRVSTEQVEEIFLEIGMTDVSLEPVYDYLKTKKIGVDESIDIDESLNAEDKNYLELYIEELSLLPKYTDGEKQAYYISAVAGHEESKKRVIDIMLPNVVDIAKLYTDQGIAIEDLIGEGNVALMAGVSMLGGLETWDEVPTALSGIIMNAMEEMIAMEADIKKNDGNMVANVSKVANAAKELSESLKRKVTISELIEETGFERELIEEALQMSGGKIEDIDIDGK